MALEKTAQQINLFTSLGQRGWQWISIAWPWLTSLSASGVMSYLASITAWLAPWGPIAWGTIFLATFVIVASVLSAVRAISAWAASRRALARYTEGTTSASLFNSLDSEFVRKRINLADFYHPFFSSNHAKIFRECELFGPAQIVLLGKGDLISSSFNECDFVIVNNKSYLHGAIVFSETEFRKCNFYRVTFLIDYNFAKIFKTGIPNAENMNIISDLTCGPL